MTKEELYKEYPKAVKVILKCIKDFRMKVGTLEFTKGIHYYGIITKDTYYLIDNSKDKHGMSVTRNVDIFTPVNTSDINTTSKPTSTLSDKITINSVIIPKL